MNPELKKEIERLQSVSESDAGWSSVRDEDYYDLREQDFGNQIGKKYSYYIKEDKKD